MATATAEQATPVQHEGFPYRFEIVPIEHMIVDAYQRPLTTFVNRIEAKFDPALVGTLCLSERSKTKFAVIDGQTRMEGMRRLGLTEAPCIVYFSLTREQEADLFAKLQTERRGMTSAARFKAEVIAGKAHAVEINNIVEGLDLTIDHNVGGPALRAVGALEFAYFGASGARRKKKAHPELLAATLEVIKDAWPKLPDTAKSAVMIRGMAHYLKANPNVDTTRLARQLSKVQPSELAKRAESLREGRGMSGNSPAYMAEAIEAQYRKR